ncbi:MAG: polysaccharide biosynthesis/export family protein, partial [bacterium]|nr:polysaccharide biosynthesis/export family protein [bacterium]
IKNLREKIASITERLEEGKTKEVASLTKELEEERRKRAEAVKEAEKAKLEVVSLTKKFDREIKDAKKEISELSKRLEVYEKEEVERGVEEKLKKAEREIDTLTKLLGEERKRREKAERERDEAIEMAKKMPKEKETRPKPTEHDVPKVPPSEEWVGLSPGDRIQIVVKGHDDLTKTVIVSQEGVITFPLIGEIYVLGLTVERLAEIITYKLGKDYIVDPQVTVTMEAEKDLPPKISICVLGGVHRPGLYRYHENMTIMQAIAMAGGVTDKAILNKIKVVREERGKREVILVNYDRFMRKGDKRENILLKPDDLIVIQEAPF